MIQLYMIFRKIRLYLLLILVGYIVRTVGVQVENTAATNSGVLLELIGVTGGIAAWVRNAPQRGVIRAVFTHFNDISRRPVLLSELEVKARNTYKDLYGPWHKGFLEGEFDLEQYEDALKVLLNEGYLWTDKDMEYVWFRGTFKSPP